MMQRIRTWFQAEYKRAWAMLPAIMVKSIIITFVMGVLFHGITYWLEAGQEEDSRLKIGYVAEEDMLTKLLVSYVSGMDSVNELCRFVSVTEEEGREELQEGKLAALLILPENVIDEILTGSNAPATLLLPKQNSALGIVFEELADAGIRMLSFAQGEIYTVYELANILELNEEQFQSACDVINAYNIELFMKRESWFHTQKVSVTGNEETAVYYGSVFAAFWLLLGGVLFGSYIKHGEQEQLLVWKRLGVSPMIQVAGRVLVTAMLLVMMLFPLSGLWILPWFREKLIPVFTWQSLLVILLSVICIAAYDMLLYQLSEEHRTAIVAVGIFAVLQGYLSGYLVPKVLLPQVVQELAVFLPTSYIRQAFSMFFSGDTQYTGRICIALLFFTMLFFLIDVAIMSYKTGTAAEGNAYYGMRKKEQKIRIRGNVFSIFIKRMLHRKSFWCSLILIVVLSIGLVGLERESETSIIAAFYDESGEWEEVLSAYDGYIQFVACENEAEVRERVLYNEVECGYCIPADFRDRLQNGESKKSIAFYRDSDAFLADTVNEVLFGQLFVQLSRDWFVTYLGDMEELIPALEHKLTDGSTFEIKKEYWNTKQQDNTSKKEKRITYPIWGVIVVAIILCGLSGVWEAIEDYRKYHFFKRSAPVMVVLSTLLPIVCGVIVFFLMLSLNSY